MSLRANLNQWLSPNEPFDTKALHRLTNAFERLSPTDRVERAVDLLPGAHVLTSSFGAQAAVMLHLVNTVCPGIPVILLDTGYLFPETYRFIDELTERLQLRLRVFRADSSPAWQETRFGRLWDQGLPGIERYNHINKREPLERALEALRAGTWFAGLRRVQASTRAAIGPIEFKSGRYKVHPIYDLTDRDVGRYLELNDLPYHPLWDQGYISIGDWHTTRSLAEAESIDDVRFFGLKRECGIHE